MSRGAALGTAWIEIVPSMKGVGAEIKRNIGSFRAAPTGTYLGRQMNKGMLAGLRLQAIGGQVMTLGGNISQVGSALTNSITKPAMIAGGVLVGAMGAGAVASVRSAKTFETSFTGVRKTVDATEEDFAALRQGIIDLSKEVPIDPNAIAGVVELGGQLGISNDSLLEFSETILALDVATNMDMETAATQLARFSNIVGTSEEDIGRLGSTLVELGNNSATTEADIMNMAMRVGAAGRQAGLSEAEILALSTAMSSVGIEAEAGGSSISRIMTQIDKDISTNSDNMAVWAQVTGKSAEEFAAIWKASPAEAIQLVAESFGTLEERGMNANVMLEKLGINGVRDADTIRRLSGATDLLAESWDMANTEWEANIALSEEAARAYDTPEARMQTLRNAVTELAIGIGDALMPAWMNIVDSLKEGAAGFQSLIPTIQRFGEVFVEVFDFGVDLVREIIREFQSLSGGTAGLEASMQSAGESIKNVMRGIADAIINLMHWWHGLSDTTRTFIQRLPLIAIAAGPVISIVGRLVTTIGLLTKGIGMVVTGVSFMFTPLGALVGLTAGLVALFSNWSNMSNAVRAAVVALTGAFGTFVAIKTAAAVASQANIVTTTLETTVLKAKAAATTLATAADKGMIGSKAALAIATKVATAAQWLLNVAMSANPIGAVIALIAGLVAIIGVVVVAIRGLIGASDDSSRSNDGLSRSLDGVARSHDRLGAAQGIQQRSAESLRRATDDLRSAQRNLDDANLDLRQSILDQTAAQEEYDRVMRDSNSTAAEREQVSINLARANGRVEDAQARANEEMFNTSLAEDSMRESYAGAELASKNLADTTESSWRSIRGCVNTGMLEAESSVEGGTTAITGHFAGMHRDLVGNSIVPEMNSAIVSSFRGMAGDSESVIGGFVGNIVGFFSGMRSDTTGSATGMKDNVSRQFGDMRSGASSRMSDMSRDVSSYAGDISTALDSRFGDGTKEALVHLRSIGSDGIEALRNFMGRFEGVGGNLIGGMLRGIAANARLVVDRMRSLATNALSAARRALGISSPSRAFAEIGRNICEGLVVGLESSMGDVVDVVGDIADSVTKAFESSATANLDIGASGASLVAAGGSLGLEPAFAGAGKGDIINNFYTPVTGYHEVIAANQIAQRRAARR